MEILNHQRYEDGEDLTAAYVRLSTDDQAVDGNALINQIEIVKSQKPDLIFIDIESGSVHDREEFSLLVEYISKGIVNKVIAKALDRLLRNDESARLLKKLIKQKKLELILVNQGEVNLDTAMGELSFDMQSAFAIHELRVIRERVLSGFVRRRADNKPGIRPPTFYQVSKEKYIIDTRSYTCLLTDRPRNYLDLYEDLDDSTRLIFRTRDKIARDAVETFIHTKSANKTLCLLHEKYGVPKKVPLKIIKDSEGKKKVKRGCIATADELVFWASGGSFQDWLLNPVLQGHTAYNKTKRKGYRTDSKHWDIRLATHPDQRLITDNEAEKIREIVELNSQCRIRQDAIFYLTGLVFCEHCKYRGILKRNSTHAYYGCRHSSTGCSNRKCVRIEKIDQAIVTALVERIVEVQRQPGIDANPTLETTQLLKKKNKLKGLEAIEDGDSDPEIRRLVTKLRLEIAREMKQLEQIPCLNETVQKIIHHDQVRNSQFWHSLTTEDRKVIYHKLVRKVLIADGEVVSVHLMF